MKKGIHPDYHFVTVALNDGTTIPQIGFGTWQTFDVGQNRADLDQRREVLEVLFEAGGKMIDSSPMYGRAEAVVGQLLTEMKARDRAFLATKVWTSGRDEGVRQIETSYRRLRVEQMDLLQVHNLVDTATHLKTLQDLKAKGIHADLVPLPGEAENLKTERASFDEAQARLQAAIDEAKEQKRPDAELKKREAALAAHLKKAPAGAKAPTLALGPAKPTHVLLRGDFLRKGAEVKPGTPGALPRPTGGTRLDLARWIVASDNPLTARVTANWVWGKFFGRGLVNTPDDFGTRGEKPSHPELLDWLASELRADWSLKKFHKLIVTSATYRQSSAVSAEALKRDPLNVLLARQSRLRLEAELMRDAALAASGLLVAAPLREMMVVAVAVTPLG